MSTEIKRQPNLFERLIEGQPRVEEFLNKKGRRSKDTKEVFTIGLSLFQTFLQLQKPPHTLENIIEPLLSNQINVYQLLNKFVSYIMKEKPDLSPNSTKLYVTAVRSYLDDYDIELGKFKKKVTLDDTIREDEEPLDVTSIRKILLACNIRRLKPYLLVLASGGMRAKEAISLRIKNFDFSTNPTTVHVISTKTKRARKIYISDEATRMVKQWIEFKYRKSDQKDKKSIKNENDLVFAVFQVRQPTPDGVYMKINEEFVKVLEAAGMDQRKDGMQRHKYTLHSFRRFTKTVIATQAGTDYSEWFIGHSKSPYWSMTEAERRTIYAKKCMEYLTFLNYTALEATGQSIDARLEQKDKEIAEIKGQLKNLMNNLMGPNKMMLTRVIDGKRVATVLEKSTQEPPTEEKLRREKLRYQSKKILDRDPTEEELDKVTLELDKRKKKS